MPGGSERRLISDMAEVTKTFSIPESNFEISRKLKKSALIPKVSPVALQFLSDVAAFILGYLIQYYIRFESGWISVPRQITTIEFIRSGLVIIVYWLVIFWTMGMYKNWFYKSPFEELFAIIRYLFFSSLLVFFAIVFDYGQSPRMLFLVYFAVNTITVAAGRITIRLIQKGMRARGLIAMPTIIIGPAAKSYQLIQKVKGNPAWGFKPVGVVLTNEAEAPEWETLDYYNTTGVPLLGLSDNLDTIVNKIDVRDAIITSENPDTDSEQLLESVEVCNYNRIEVKIEEHLYKVFTGQMRALSIYGMPLILVTPQLLKPWQEIIKRFIDIIFSFLVIVIGMPLWLLISLIIRLESRGNVLYSQDRVGKNSKVFKIYKFRSMVQDAEKGGPQWTKVNDPRVTRFGYFLRKSHIDEIPQFWNVLLGDMSIVGPRPERPQFVEKFTSILPHYKRRLILRPGLTGWWQIHYTTYAESTEEIENRLKDDFYYIENISLKLDIEIIIRTVFLVFKGHGQA